MARDSRIDTYIDKAPEFAQPVLRHLREQVHAACPEVEEGIKWSRPHFLLDGQILAGMSAFKEHCSFGFWQREGTPKRDDERDGMGQFGRLTTVADLPRPALLKAAIRQAAEALQSGAKRAAPSTPRPKLEAPEDLLSALAGNAEAERHFKAFAPGKQRDYVEWVLEAKRPETRAKRVAQSIEWLAEGKARHWKYENC